MLRSRLYLIRSHRLEHKSQMDFTLGKAYLPIQYTPIHLKDGFTDIKIGIPMPV